MRAPPSSSRERGEREACPGRARALREDVPPRALERVERGEPTTREQPDGAADAAADARLQQAPGGKQRACAFGLEAQQLGQLGARAVESDDAKPAAILCGQVDPAQREVPGHVLRSEERRVGKEWR